MDNYQNTSFEYSKNAVSESEKERIAKERHQNRFNYYNSVIATLALILSIISIVMQLLK